MVFTYLSALLLFGAAAAKRSETRAEAPWFVGVPAFTALDRLPYLRPGVQTRQFCSYDRAGDNYDADYFPIYVEPDGSQVIFDSYGPGCLYRLHMNIWNGDVSGVNIRFYFDGETKPRIDMDVTKFFSEENPLGIFKEPLAHIGEGYRLVYHPFFYSKRLKISLSKEPLGVAPPWNWFPWTGRYDQHPHRRNHWYTFTYHTFTENPGLTTWTKPIDMSTVAALWNPANIGSPPEAFKGGLADLASLSVPSKATKTLADLHGQGTISELHISVSPQDEATLFDTWLTITFDGAANPQVEVPLGCMFGKYRTALDKPIQSMFVGTKGSDMYCYLPMPYWKSVVVALSNRGSEAVTGVDARIVHVPATRLRYPKKDCGYFHAVYRREAPRTEGHDYRYVDLRGRGQVVGHVAYRWKTSMEEDERTYFDDAAAPRIYGEGYEDDHNQGWGLKDLERATWGSAASDGGAGAPWRFFTPDLYVFQSMVRFGHQTYGPHSPLGHEGMYEVGTEESVAFLYMQGKEGLKLTDALDVGNAVSERAHAYKVIGRRQNRKGKWWYDGEFNNVLFPVPAIADDGVSTVKGSRFAVKIDPANRGVLLRRRTDKDNNRQLANVYVDGALVEERPWYNVDFEHTYRSIRWFDADFEIPARYTRGKKRISIRIEPLSSKTGKWDEFRYWVYSNR